MVLLADAVGLGKTIQAALAIAALRDARRRGPRADPHACGPPRPVAVRDRAALPIPRRRRRCRVAPQRAAHDAGGRQPVDASGHGDRLDRLRQAAGGARRGVGCALGSAGDRRGAHGGRADRPARGGGGAGLVRAARRCCSPRRPTPAATRNSLPSARSECVAGDARQPSFIRRTRSDVGLDSARRVRVARLTLSAARTPDARSAPRVRAARCGASAAHSPPRHASP